MQGPATHLTPTSSLRERLGVFWALPLWAKYIRAGQRLRKIWPGLPLPIRLPFGAWWITKGSALDYELMMRNGFETAEIRFVQRFLRPGMTVLDIGAHHGLYSLLSSKIVGPQGKVVAFEPSPRERERLTRHLWINKCKNVRVEECALGKETGEAELFLVHGREDWCNSMRVPNDGTRRGLTSVHVKVERLDDKLASANIQRADFVKMDVEGAELDILRGASKLLRGTERPVILAEVCDIRTKPWGYAAREIVRLLDEMNYRWFGLELNGLPQPILDTQQSYDANLVAIPTERMESVLAELGKA